MRGWDTVFNAVKEFRPNIRRKGHQKKDEQAPGGGSDWEIFEKTDSV